MAIEITPAAEKFIRRIIRFAGLPDGASRAGITATALSAPRGPAVAVQSVTSFASSSALHAAQSGEAYARAMAAVTQLLRKGGGSGGPAAAAEEEPQQLWVDVAGAVGREGAPGGGSPGEDAVGAELGLR